MAMGCRQCLSLSDVQLKGKHCRKPHCRNGVVDTFGHYQIIRTRTMFFSEVALEGVFFCITTIHHAYVLRCCLLSQILPIIMHDTVPGYLDNIFARLICTLRIDLNWFKFFSGCRLNGQLFSKFQRCANCPYCAESWFVDLSSMT